MSSKKSKVTDKDLYEFLGILSTATEKEVKTAKNFSPFRFRPYSMNLELINPNF